MRPAESQPQAVDGSRGELECRHWTAPDGVEWTVEVAGRSRTGRNSSPGADVALLLFRPAAVVAEASGGPDGAERHTGAREVVAALRSLDVLSDDALAGLFRAARPFRPELTDRREPTSGRRRSRRG